MTAAEEVDVGEVPPAGVDRSAGHGSDDPLGVHHHERIPPYDDLTAEQAWKVQLLGCGSDRVTHVDVDMEVGTGRCQLGVHRDPDAAVGVFVADCRRGGSVHVEHHTVVEAPSRDLADDRSDVVRVVVERLGLEIDVASRPAFPEGGQEYPAFQDELVGEARLGQAGEERFQDVELQQLVDRPAIATSLGPKVEVGPTR